MVLHEVITTEKVPFSYRVAGLGSRFLALVVDLLVMLLLLFVGLWFATVVENARFGVGQAVMSLWLFGVFWGYFLLFEWLWHGQTPGKRALGIRVIQWDGTRVSFFGAAVRNLLRIIDLLPALFGVGFLVAACNRENRRLGDLAANTLVVHVERKAQPIRALHERATATDRDAEFMLRQRLETLNREQKQTLLDVCLRRDQLQVGDRARLFQALAGYVKDRFGLSPPQYQSDEKFVLQLAAALTGEAGRLNAKGPGR